MSIESFIKEFRSIGYENPMNPREIVVNDVKVDLTQTYDDYPAIRLHSIESITKKSGNASNVLDKVAYLADKHDVRVRLTPDKFGHGGLNNTELKSWYKRHGFKIRSKGGMEYKPVKKGAWATEFMEGYNQMGKVNFMDKRDRLIDGVSVNLSDYEENDKVIKIWTVMSRVHGQGSGSKVLEKLKALADETKTSIVLKPGAWGLAPVLTVPQLKEWYMRHGFKEMKNGWLIYKPKGVTVKVNLEKHLGAGFWAKKAKRKRASSAKAGRLCR